MGLSIDSPDEKSQHALGRGNGNHVSRTTKLSEKCHKLGLRIKLNTVLTSYTWKQDMTALILKLHPERWKIFQVLPVVGQNDHSIYPLLITPEQFTHFIGRHASIRKQGIEVVPEDNNAMLDSYVMIDPIGRFISNTDGIQTYSKPILEVGLEKALSEAGFNPEKFDSRGGGYQW